MKDCEVVEDLNEEGFKEFEEKELSFGQWLRPSPLPKIGEELKKRDQAQVPVTRTFLTSPRDKVVVNLKGKETQKKNGSNKKIERGY